MSKEEKKVVDIPVGGSLGILAYGDIGLKAWRKVRDAANDKQELEANKKNEKNKTENE